MTKRELISQIKSQLRLVNADSTVSNRFVWSLIDKHLRWLIKRENSKYNLYDLQEIFQTYKCVDVHEAPSIDDCCGVRSKCTVQRTFAKIPDVYEDNHGVIIKSVFSIDGSTDFTPINIVEYMRKLENPTTRKYDKGRYYYYNNGYLYFPKSRVKKVMVKGYFIDEVDNNCDPCNDCEGSKTCISKLDENVRIPSFILGELMDFVIKDLINSTLKIQPDQQIDKNETRKD